ncbi:MAG: hypothetical protein A2534_04645 [Candidatus Magasanikbacteria bacterium RIFOXYD2_FULL_39_9]|uniref:Uncharacterized protein n=1 Tax=Candidatus Magasanikbacteria bacterium RIFOXYD1_FULL_40_23 TaxID=1798705 RepID=A0A1F6PBH0_9BACT|nr:MAG: hypothetical protein A2534_04645 [Candidatus Magasanikbacteria bacterium RIFOXYD2_FULL_39_9]OGH93313.1 MAG: hypothetical protein A2563_01760 [Candidatus Magasanikbacteria bacterium RIFOXYD1_FULL_40_23]
MLALAIVLGVLLAFFAPVAIFLGTEFLKKFRCMYVFTKNSDQMISWYHIGDGFRKKGMYNIVLRGQKPFTALVGFKLDIPVLGYSGYDYYGVVHSDSSGVAVISTYLGKGFCTFQFFVNTNMETNPIHATSSDEDQTLTPHVVYPPHWYQRVGFYG